MSILKHINIRPKKRPPLGGLVWEENKHKANSKPFAYPIIYATLLQSTDIFVYELLYLTTLIT